MTKGWVYNHYTKITRFKSKQEKTSFVDPKVLISDPDPDQTFQSVTDPDPTTRSFRIRIRIRIQVSQKFRIRADPDPQHCLRLCRQMLNLNPGCCNT